MFPTMGSLLRDQIARQEAEIANASSPPPGYTTDKDGSIVKGSVYDDDARSEPRVHLMRPTIHVQLQVRKIVANNYDHARTLAFDECRKAWGLEHMLYGTLGTDEFEWEDKWNELARVAKEVDGTYTVTLP